LSFAEAIVGPKLRKRLQFTIRHFSPRDLLRMGSY
jgi:hypothetical protein